jgi:hypothetical protein
MLLDTLVITSLDESIIVVGHCSLLLLDKLFITFGHVVHYCCWTVCHYCCWTCLSLLLLDTLFITVVGHVHYCFWTLCSLLLLDTLVITVAGHVGHYCCWIRCSLLLLDRLVINVVGHLFWGSHVGTLGSYCWEVVGTWITYEYKSLALQSKNSS